MDKRILLSLALLTLSACSSKSGGSISPVVTNETLVVDQLVARHRSGQTFVLWPETSANARYNVYRHNQAITEENLGNATLLTSRWGSLGPDTSVNKYAGTNIPSTFVVSDLSLPLDTDTGMFVYTIPNGQQTQSYYAFTSIVNGQEDTSMVPGKNTLTTPVQESTARPSPVLTTSVNDGKGRVYTQYMDYNNWNPTLNGYAYSYAVTLPYNYNPATAYPLQLHLHAFGDGYVFREETEYEWEFIKVLPTDPGGQQNSVHTWWYGFAADHNYSVDGSIPTTGTIENFTEQRVLSAVQDVMNHSDINVNSDLVHIVGHSMGASGALTLGLRYPDVFAGVYASQPMTDYASSTTFQANFAQIWGEQSSNLPIVNNGPDSGSIDRYDINGSSPTGVWNWMNHLEQIRRRKADDFAYLMIDHGKADNTIDWETQGQPLTQALTDAKVGFSATAYADIGHVWLGFSAVVNSMFGLGFGDESSWRYPNSLSFPAIANASGSSSINPNATTDSSYNANIEWSTSANAFDEPIIETSNQYQISMRSTDAEQTASITPRNTRTFRINSGQRCNWSVTNNANSQLMQNGTAVADSAGLITVVDVRILTGSGSRLAIAC